MRKHKICISCAYTKSDWRSDSLGCGEEENIQYQILVLHADPSSAWSWSVGTCNAIRGMLLKTKWRTKPRKGYITDFFVHFYPIYYGTWSVWTLHDWGGGAFYGTALSLCTWSCQYGSIYPRILCISNEKLPVKCIGQVGHGKIQAKS